MGIFAYSLFWQIYAKPVGRGLDPAAFSLSRITAIKNSPTHCVRLPFVTVKPLPTHRRGFFPTPRGLSRGLTKRPLDCWNRPGRKTAGPYGLRCPHRPAPLGRAAASATAAPAPAPCFRRRRRSPSQLFSSSDGAQTAAAFRIIATKKSPTFSVRLCNGNTSTPVPSQFLSLSPGTLPRSKKGPLDPFCPPVRRTAGPYGLRCPHRPAPLGRDATSATAAPASAPCFRRRRRSPSQLFSSSERANQKQSPHGGIRRRQPPARSAFLHIPRGLSHALKRVHWTLFARRYAGRRARAVLVLRWCTDCRNIPGYCNKKTALHSV